MTMHAAAVVPEEGFWHEGDGLSILIRDIADYIFVKHHVVRRLNQRVEALVDFTLPAGGNFVMVAFDIEAALDHHFHHLGPQILIMIGWRNGEISFLVPWTISEIVLLTAGVPAALFGIYEIETGMLI